MPQRRGRRRHVDAEGSVDGLVAYAETEDHPSPGGIGDQAGRFGAGVGVAHVDARDPRADFDLPGGRAHQLRRGEGIVVHFGGKDRVEPGFFGLACDGHDLGSAPPGAGN
jgi:hypothetical protein